jgi:hypothetical protein
MLLNKTNCLNLRLFALLVSMSAIFFFNLANTPSRGILRLGWCGSLVMLWSLLSTANSQAGAERSQSFELEEGWNAIYLDVDPADDRVESVFASQLVDVVARYFVPSTPVRFIENSAESPWNTAGWSVWYSSRRAESFLSNLHAVHGGAAYLVHAVKAGTLQITGEVKLRPVEWMAESFNLCGFPVESPGLTFAQYFAGSSNRIGSRVYRLKKGSWEKIPNLTSTAIKPGEACWVYCDGNTTYPGPLEIDPAGGTTVHFNSWSLSTIVQLRNQSNASFAVSVGLESNEGLPLYRRVVNLSELTSESVLLTTSAAPLGQLAPGATMPFRLDLRRELFAGAAGSAILSFRTSHGLVLRVPVHFKPQ